MFASCANNSDSDDNGLGNQSTSLPTNVGTNPIENEIKLISEDDEYRYLVLRNDGTALEIHCDDDDVEEEKTYATFKYTYNDEERTISMKMEKCIYYSEFYESDNNDNKLLTYEQILSKINEDYTVEKMRKYNQEYYEERKEEEWFEEKYPDCDTYEKYETALFKECGVDSFNDYVKTFKQSEENYYKSMFGAQVTYAYRIENNKMILTEKFTGVKNLLDSECEYENHDGNYYTDASIDCSYAKISEYDSKNRFEEYCYGYPNADKRTIDFEKVRDTWTEDWKHESVSLGNVTATYTEDIRGKTVTIKCEGKEYVCKFRGINFIQTDD
ncbi:MAG: hypothetical protein HDR35_01515 [Treponema sp.]|nr:hypothetical protein [Treponema sp.]